MSRLRTVTEEVVRHLIETKISPGLNLRSDVQQLNGMLSEHLGQTRFASDLLDRATDLLRCGDRTPHDFEILLNTDIEEEIFELLMQRSFMKSVRVRLREEGVDPEEATQEDIFPVCESLLGLDEDFVSYAEWSAWGEKYLLRVHRLNFDRAFGWYSQYDYYVQLNLPMIAFTARRDGLDGFDFAMVVLFHEIAHAAHHRVASTLSGYSNFVKEGLAEICSYILSLSSFRHARLDSWAKHTYDKKYTAWRFHQPASECPLLHDQDLALRLLAAMAESQPGESLEDIFFLSGTTVGQQALSLVELSFSRINPRSGAVRKLTSRIKWALIRLTHLAAAGHIFEVSQLIMNAESRLRKVSSQSDLETWLISLDAAAASLEF